MKSDAWRKTLVEITATAMVLLREKIAGTNAEAAEMAGRIVTGGSLDAFADRP